MGKILLYSGLDTAWLGLVTWCGDMGPCDHDTLPGDRQSFGR